MTSRPSMPSMPTLRVVHAVLSLDVGGLERIVLDLVRVARKRGHEVLVLCLERQGQLAPEAEAAGAKIVCFDKPPGRQPEIVSAASRLLTQYRPTVVHSHQIGPTWYLGQAARSTGMVLVHTEHGNPFARCSSWLETVRVRAFYRRAARFASLFSCVSEEIAISARRWGTVPSAKLRVIPSGIDTSLTPSDSASEARERLGIPAAARVVGTVGRLAPVKQQDLLLRAVARLPNTHALLVGDGPELGALQRLSAELGILERVHFAGYQSRPQDWYPIMDVFALTSRSEGIPISLLEAWAASRPAVCTAVGGIPAVMTDGRDGVLVAPGDLEGFTTSLAGLLADSKRAAVLGAAGRATVEQHYSLERMANDYESLYKSAGGKW